MILDTVVYLPQIIPDCTILSRGIGYSDGVVVFDGNTCCYIPNVNADLGKIWTDISTTIKEIQAIITTITTGFNTVIPGQSGGSIAALNPTTVSDLTASNAKLAALDAQIKVETNTSI
jgi:hypothetical protein